MSSSNPSTGPDPTVEEQLDLALQRAAIEEVLSASRTYLTACFAIYGWDFILTFPDEYRTMWNAERWTPVRVAFFISRQATLFYGGLLHLVGFMCLYWLKIDLKTCNKIHLLPPLSTLIISRGYLSLNLKARGLTVSLLLYDTTVTIFVIIPLISHWRKAPRTRLLTIFARDGLVYFVVVSICNLINAVYFSIPGVVNPALNVPLSVTFTPMMACRIVLHLRSVGSVNLREEGPSSGSGSRLRNNMNPNFGNHNQPGTHGRGEVRLENLGRQVDGTALPISFEDAVVKGESVTNLGKGLDLSPDVDTHDQYSSSQYGVHVVAKKQ
ncbi:hypothetical protein BT69DRAFT_1350656 [Atractiella rhizophila]|nr:hypothetical protein BT69DRAFT_1350656 [Atractiella rhizophila]